jgi:phospholipid/cholesterol/gamma-HCH transport system ATP-binding protein
MTSAVVPLVELKGVSKTFGSQKVLNGIDLTIYPGEAIAIIGPSGTGKSTVLRIIAGLLAPDEGEIWINGKVRQGLAEDNLTSSGIGMVFQQAALFDSLTVDENVGFLLYQHSTLPKAEIRALVNQCLRTVGLPNIGDRYPAELSGGMRKRVSFARAILENPQNPEDTPNVLLYDEPTAGLDPIASTIIEDLVCRVREVSGRGRSSVMVTHQESTIRRTAERILFLYQGQVKWEGRLAEIDTTDNGLVRQFFAGEVTGPIRILD